MAGGIGDDTALDSSVHPPVIENLNYQFDTFPVDALLSGFPSYIITEAARNEFAKSGVTGVKFSDVNISTSDMFIEVREAFHRDQMLPAFVWLKIEGRAGRDDFGIAKDNRLVISQRALSILQPLGIENAVIEPFLEADL